MKANPIVIEHTVNADISRVWKAITDVGEIKQWYFEMQEFLPKPGFGFKIYGGNEDGRQFPISCKIQAVEEGKRLSYTWNYDDFPAETLVTFELLKEGGITLVRLTHEGLEKIAPRHKEVSRENHREGWNHIIGKLLKEHVERK